MTYLEIARNALPLRVDSFEVLEYNLNIAGPEWHFNATCDHFLSAGNRRYDRDSAADAAVELAREFVGSRLVGVESSVDVDDPTLMFDNGFELSVRADRDDPYEPWVLHIPGITIPGTPPSQIGGPVDVEVGNIQGEISDPGRIRSANTFPPGFSLSGEEGWGVVVACPWKVISSGSVEVEGPSDWPAERLVGTRLVLIRYTNHEIELTFDDGTVIQAVADEGRDPWHVRFPERRASVQGRPRHGEN